MLFVHSFPRVAVWLGDVCIVHTVHISCLPNGIKLGTLIEGHFHKPRTVFFDLSVHLKCKGFMLCLDAHQIKLRLASNIHHGCLMSWTCTCVDCSRLPHWLHTYPKQASWAVSSDPATRFVVNCFKIYAVLTCTSQVKTVTRLHAYVYIHIWN